MPICLGQNRKEKKKCVRKASRANPEIEMKGDGQYHEENEKLTAKLISLPDLMEFTITPKLCTPIS